MTTNIDADSNLELLIVGSVVSDISIVGAGYGPKSGILNLGKVAPGEGVKANLKVLVKGPFRSDVDVDVREVDPANALSAHVGDEQAINDGAVYIHPLTIEVPADAHPASHLSSRRDELGRIVIETTHPIAKEIIIYVRFAVE